MKLLKLATISMMAYCVSVGNGFSAALIDAAFGEGLATITGQITTLRGLSLQLEEERNNLEAERNALQAQKNDLCQFSRFLLEGNINPATRNYYRNLIDNPATQPQRENITISPLPSIAAGGWAAGGISQSSVTAIENLMTRCGHYNPIAQDNLRYIGVMQRNLILPMRENKYCRLLLVWR
jgi:hypothetical protein